jgi:hypothetical protein
MAGRSPDGSGSRPTGRATDGVSPVPASIPNASDLLLDVLGRVGAASGPDRELDVRIYHAISPGLGCTWEEFSAGMVFEKNNWCHRYTASIDSALALLPPHTLWAVANMEDGPIARVVRPMPNGGYTGGYLEAAGRTPPLALACAALQVLAAQAIEARRAETLQDGSVHESAVGTADAPNPGQSSGMPKGGEL